MIFAIKDFYPSIKEKLLNEAIFVKTLVNIYKKDEEIIKHSKTSLLFNGYDTWIKSKSSLFDVTIGAYDGVETGEKRFKYLVTRIN